jgi:uncharacterized protein YeaO (DUF488 family)
MLIYKTKLKSRQEIAAGAMAFHFEKPEGFAYKAGQFADYTLINPPETDAEGNTRGFSLASAPYEDDLMLATRMRDTAFKRVLKNMELGTELTLDAPYGSFTLHNNTQIPAVFLTGGIGVTPVRSIVLQAVHDNVPHRIVVFDSNRRPEDAAFLDELMEPQKKNPNYTFVGTMTQMEKSGREWHGETGYITKAMLLKYVGDLTLPIYYIDGPPAMVTAMRETLGEAGVDDDDIRTEEFSGYSEAEQMWDMNIKIKRVYEQPDKDDGRRILVDRIWPRGISKDEARLSDWRKDLAPSNELRKWFAHDSELWEEFKERYRAELEEAGKMGDLRDIVERAEEENVTLLFGAKDTKHNNARALEAFVGEV